MRVSLEYLTQCAAETGYRVEPLEKVVRLGQLAGDIARHPFLGTVLALKGGTALNLCYGPPKRLSVDLDYNYGGEIERQKMLEDRPRVEAAAAEIAKRQGYRVQQSADAFAGFPTTFDGPGEQSMIALMRRSLPQSLVRNRHAPAWSAASE
jgi:predicted nucleotidyltransferase component of viral defense system